VLCPSVTIHVPRFTYFAVAPDPKREGLTLLASRWKFSALTEALGKNTGFQLALWYYKGMNFQRGNVKRRKLRKGDGNCRSDYGV